MAKKLSHGGKRKGAGRPAGPDGPTVAMAVTVPQSLLDDLDRLVKAKDGKAGEKWTRSRAVTEAIRGFLARSKQRT